MIVMTTGKGGEVNVETTEEKQNDYQLTNSNMSNAQVL